MIRDRKATVEVPKDRVLYHDLIKVVRHTRQRPGIYWFRLIRAASGVRVGVLTEVPGNPGLSVCNDIEGILQYLDEKYELREDSTAIFEIWPRGCIDEDVQINRVSFEASVSWDAAQREDIETLAGGALPPLPNHEELYARVRAFGGGTEEELWRPRFEVFPVTELPPPHNPSRCDYASTFRNLEAESSCAPPGLHDATLAVGQHFIEALARLDRSQCWYHRANWKTIADESVRILRRIGHENPDRYRAEVRKSKLPQRDRRWLDSLFADPIFVNGGTYTNGQHRGCALRFSGATHAAIHTNDESLGTVCNDWVYLGGG